MKVEASSPLLVKVNGLGAWNLKSFVLKYQEQHGQPPNIISLWELGELPGDHMLWLLEAFNLVSRDQICEYINRACQLSPHYSRHGSHDYWRARFRDQIISSRNGGNKTNWLSAAYAVQMAEHFIGLNYEYYLGIILIGQFPEMPDKVVRYFNSEAFDHES